MTLFPAPKSDFKGKWNAAWEYTVRPIRYVWNILYEITSNKLFFKSFIWHYSMFFSKAPVPKVKHDKFSNGLLAKPSLNRSHKSPEWTPSVEHVGEQWARHKSISDSWCDECFAINCLDKYWSRTRITFYKQEFKLRTLSRLFTAFCLLATLIFIQHIDKNTLSQSLLKIKYKIIFNIKRLYLEKWCAYPASRSVLAGFGSSSPTTLRRKSDR